MDKILVIAIIGVSIFIAIRIHKKNAQTVKKNKVIAKYYKNYINLNSNQKELAKKELAEVGIKGEKGRQYYIKEKLLYVVVATVLAMIAMSFTLICLSYEVDSGTELSRLLVLLTLCMGALKFHNLYKVSKLNFMLTNDD